MAWINNKCNHGYTFTIDALPAGDDARALLTASLASKQIKYSGLQLECVTSWRPTIEETMLRWLLQFKDPRMDHLHDPKRSFSLFFDDFHDMFLHDPLSWFDELVVDCELWKVIMQPIGFYECSWDDFLFHASDRSYWLHFGVSD